MKRTAFCLIVQACHATESGKIAALDPERSSAVTWVERSEARQTEVQAETDGVALPTLVQLRFAC